MTRSRFSPAVLAALAVRLTHRDRRILRAVWDHRVLTSQQITKLFFDTDTATRKRLLTLHHMGLLERFRPNRPIGMGAAPYHYVLGAAGAAVLAAEDGVDFPAFGYRRDRALGIALNQRLAHTVGVNDFYADLSWHARRHEDSCLVTWWPEHRCGAMWGETARPDGYGRWAENGHSLDFFLEFDTGTEPLDRVAAKLSGYRALARGSTITTPVLFSVHSNRREVNLRKRLLGHHAAELVPIATASRALLFSDDGPAGALWLPIEAGGPRLRLAELASHWPHLGRRETAEPPEGSRR
ncbi:replication-relaxation family protein [Microtetraspora fusca]|uniref:Replication-relaxation family protein n=1 Tax=Microtetraspora fusca TaxID=1997 RepID=A0ABW6UZQ3_MICFU